MNTTLSEKYTSDPVVASQWDVKWIITLFSMILIYGLIAILINYLSIRFLVTKVMKTIGLSRKVMLSLQSVLCIIMLASVITFSIILVIIRLFSPSNFVHMACSLLLEYTWMLTVIFASLLLRVEGSQTHNAYRIYYPLIMIGFFVITFRIVMLPSSIVTLLFPPYYLSTPVAGKNDLQISQACTSLRPELAYMSQLVFVFSLVSAWIGYTMFAVQVIIWWSMAIGMYSYNRLLQRLSESI